MVEILGGLGCYRGLELTQLAGRRVRDYSDYVADEWEFFGVSADRVSR